MISDALIIISTLASGWLIGYAIGTWRGRQRGRDEQWIESYFDSASDEKLRRDKDGRFKTKTKTK